jgi:Ring finger domain
MMDAIHCQNAVSYFENMIDEIEYSKDTVHEIENKLNGIEREITEGDFGGYDEERQRLIQKMDLIRAFLYENKQIEETEGKTCVICLCDFNMEEKITRTHCNHMFHSACLRTWTRMNQTCPECRNNIF